MPRVQKDKILQLSRSKEMAEVFTPSWICNAQNNLVDNSWFGTEGVFNKEILLKNGTKSWEITKEKIAFPKDKLNEILEEIRALKASHSTQNTQPASIQEPNPEPDSQPAPEPEPEPEPAPQENKLINFMAALFR